MSNMPRRQPAGRLFDRRNMRRLLSVRITGLLAIGLFAVIRVFDPIPVVALRNLMFDVYQNVEPPPAGERHVLIVDIDERSLKEIGQWPWSRATVADLVGRLSAAGALVVGFDVIFAEPDRLSPPRYARSLGPLSETVRSELAGLPDSDDVLAQALAKSKVVLGQAGSASPGAGATDEGLPASSIATIGGSPREHLLGFPWLVTNLPGLEQVASGRGMLSIRPERDGVIRRIPLVAVAGERVVPALSIELIRVAAGAKTSIVKSDEAGVRSVVVAGVEIPTDRTGHLWLHFGRHDRSRYVSAADVLRNDDVQQQAGGKIVLIGTSAAGLFDLRATPVERVIPGVEIHAQAVDGILSGTILERPNYALGGELTLAVVVSLAIMLAVPRLGARSTFLRGGAAAAILAGISWHLFAREKVLLDVTYPLVSGGSVFLLLTFQNYLREERQRTQIRNAFRHYLSAEMVERLVREPERLALGGETRDMTILFTDFRGFTAIAETFKSNPAGLTALMNRLLSPLSRAVVERQGTIDKYIGDAIMAFWNAPLDDPDHARHACEAALEILRRLDALNAESLEAARLDQRPAIMPEIGIGIASGSSVVGNMGSDIRFDYSVMGDSVNIASRLQGLTRQYGLRVLVSSTTAAACRSEMALLEVDRVLLKGKADAETIYALVGDGLVLRSREFEALAAAVQRLLGALGDGDVEQARSSLGDCRRVPGFEALAPLFDDYGRRIGELAEGRVPRPTIGAT